MDTQEFFDRIFHGYINPSEKSYLYDERYQQLAADAHCLELELFSNLGFTEEQRKGLSELLKAYEKVWNYKQVDQFKDGFCLGGRLTIAIMQSQTTEFEEANE